MFPVDGVIRTPRVPVCGNKTTFVGQPGGFERLNTSVRGDEDTQIIRQRGPILKVERRRVHFHETNLQMDENPPLCEELFQIGPDFWTTGGNRHSLSLIR